MTVNNLTTTDQLHNAALLIDEGKKQASSGFLLMGSALSLVLHQKLWVDSFNNFGEFCTNVGISRSYAYKLVQIWDKWGDRARGIDVHRLQQLLPMKLENEGEILEQARELNPGAFSDVLRELKGLTPTDACTHDETGSYCKKCNKRL
jgi:hypothetical protein